MYLNDLFDVPGELNWSRLDLYEILNTKTKINWNQKNNIAIGKFEIDEVNYTIELEAGVYKKWQFINISFYREDKEYELALDTKSPAKVLGTIINGVFEKLNEFHYDAIMFTAANNVEKRMSFYNKLANMFKKHFAKVVEDVKSKNGKFTILIANTIKKPEIDDFIEHLKDNIVK